MQSKIEAEESKPEKSAGVYIKLADTLAKQKSLEEAINYYHQQALALNPENERLYLALGNTYAQQKQFNEAIGNYQRAIKPKADYDNAYKSLGNVLR